MGLMRRWLVLGDLLVLKLCAAIAHLRMFTCMLAHLEKAARRERSSACWLSACFGLLEAVNRLRSSAKPAELEVSYEVVTPTLASWRKRNSELMNRQKIRGDSTAPCFTPLLSGMGAVVPASLVEWKVEPARRSAMSTQVCAFRTC